MAARIVAYTYAVAGTATGAVHPAHASTSTIGSIEQPTDPTVTYARPLAPMLFYAPEDGTDQLRSWAATLITYTPTGTYSATYSPTTRRVTIESTNATDFRPVMVENGAEWSGFTQTLAGFATSWTGVSAPAAVAELLCATVEPAEDGARVDVRNYRLGRSAAIVWGNHQTYKVTLTYKSTNGQILDPGYLATGRVRITQADAMGAISPINPGGYLDGYVVASTDPVEDGDIGELWSVQLLVAVSR